MLTNIAMKLSWPRLIVSLAIVLAALSGAASSVAAPSVHDCASMVLLDDCPDHAGGDATAPRHCDSLACGALQLTPSKMQAPAALTTVDRARLILDDSAHLGLSAPPDLRPPIL